MTDLIPNTSPAKTHVSEPNLAKKSNIWLASWITTLCLHGIIFLGAYGLYQRAVQSNQSLAKAKSVPLSATTSTEQKVILKTITDSTTPIAIIQEPYTPSPKVRSDLPVLTTADIIAQGNAIRAAQEGHTVDSAVSTTALTTLSAVSSTAKTSLQTDKKINERTTMIMIDASDEALTDRDIPAKERKNGTKTTPDPLVTDNNIKAKNSKVVKNGTATTSKGKIQKTDQAEQNSNEAEQLSKELEQTNADLSHNIDIIKNKNRQKIAKEFNTKPSNTPKDDDSLHSEDIPTKNN